MLEWAPSQRLRRQLFLAGLKTVKPDVKCRRRPIHRQLGPDPTQAAVYQLDGRTLASPGGVDISTVHPAFVKGHP